jgi:hypothetical protein
MREEIMANYNRQYKGFSRKMVTGDYHLVVCKCPFCGTPHIEKFQNVPTVQPRRYCPDHRFMRDESAEGSGYMKRESIKSHREGA